MLLCCACRRVRARLLLQGSHVAVGSTVFGGRGDALRGLTIDGAAMLVRGAAPAALLGWVLDPLDRGEVVLVLLHGDDPGHAVKGDGAEAEVYEGARGAALVNRRGKGQFEGEGIGMHIHVLSGICMTAATNDSRLGVAVALTWVMKLVGARPYW